MNGPAVNQLWFDALKTRPGSAQQSNATLSACSRQREVQAVWLRLVLPECCDERGEPHARFMGALTILSYALGKGQVRRDMVKERVRRLDPVAYAEVYGTEPVAS